MAKAGKLVVDLEMNEAKFAAAVKNAEREAQRLNKRLEAQSETFGQTARAAKIYALEQKGATSATIDQAKALDSLINEQEELQRLQTRAAAIVKQVQTPTERYKQTVGELDTLLAKGAISTETYARAQRQAQTAMKGTSLIARQAGEDIRNLVHKLGPIILAYKAFQGIKEAFANSDDAGVKQANEALQEANAAFDRMFERVAKAIAPAVEALADVFTFVADTVGSVLVPVLEVAATIVRGMVDALKAVGGALDDINIFDAVNEYNAAQDRAAELDQVSAPKWTEKYTDAASDEEVARRAAEEQKRLADIAKEAGGTRPQALDNLADIFGGLGKEFLRGAELAKVQQEQEAAAKAVEEAAKKAREEQEKLMQSGKQLALSLRTPWEVAADELARYDELLKRGAIDQETFNRAQEKIQAGLRTEANTAIARLDLPAGFQRGSAEAISAVNQFRNENRLSSVAEQQRDILKEIRDLMRQRQAQQEIVFN